MNEIVDAIKARFRSPILGYALLTSAFVNWKAIFFLVVDTGTVASRIEYFDAHTTHASLFWIPVGISIALVLTGPWTRYLLALAASKPVHFYEILGVRAEHEVLIEKKMLEDQRAKILASAENELIDRAARDEKIESLANEEIRDRLRAEIAQLRSERDALNPTKDAPSSPGLVLTKEALDLLTAAVAGDGTMGVREYLGGTQVHANSKNFANGRSPREIAKWKGAIQELEQQNFVEDRTGNGDLYFVTREGYEFMDASPKQ